MNNGSRLMVGTVVIAAIGLFSSCKDLNTGPPPPAHPQWKIYNSSNSPITSKRIRAVYADHGNTVWIGTDSGAYAYKNKRWNKYTDEVAYYLPADTFIHTRSVVIGNDTTFYYDTTIVRPRETTITAIAESYDGSMWFGEQIGGVMRYKIASAYGPWRRYTTPNILMNPITAIGTGFFTNGDVWVGTFTGIARCTINYQGGAEDSSKEKWSVVSASNTSIPGNDVSAIAENPYDQVMWFGTSSHGIFLYNKANSVWSSFVLSEGSTGYINPRVTAITFEATGNAWMSTYSGIFSMKTSTYELNYYSCDNSGKIIPTSPLSSALAFDGHTRWFGSDSGLVCLKEGTWSALSKRNSPLPDNNITTLCYDTAKNLWIGTLYGGLVEYNPDGIVE